MAHITYGFGVQNVSGKIGGTVHSNTAYGTIIKSKSQRRSSTSPLQREQQTILQQVVSLWALLTQSQRIAWNTFATFYNSFPSSSSSRKLNGYNCFLEINNNLALIGGTFLLDPIFDTINTQLQFVSFTVKSDQIDFVVPDDFPSEQWGAFMQFTPPLSPGISNPSRHWVFVEIDSYLSHVYSFINHYTSRFGIAPQINRAIYSRCSFINITNGLRTNAIQNHHLIEE